MNAVLQFLVSLRNLYKSGVITSVDQAIDFAKQQFGQIDDLFKRQIEQVFKVKPKKDIPPGGGGITSIKNAPKKETPSQESGISFSIPERGIFRKEGSIEEITNMIKKPGLIDEIEASGKKLEGAANKMAEIQKEIDAMYKPKPETSPLMERLEGGIETLKSMKQPGMDLVTGLTRTAARKILDRAGIQVPDKVDAIDVFVKEFGADPLMDVKDVAEEMIELERMGRSLKSMDEILEQSGMFNIKRNPDAPKGLSDEQLEQIKKEVDQEKQIKDFDPTDREPNSMGGFNRIGFADGPPKPKGKGIMKVIKKIPKVGKIAGGLETAIGAIQKKFGPDAIKTADELPAKEPTDFQKFEARELVTNTISDVKKLEPIDAMKEVNKVIAREGKYKNLSDEQVKKIFDDTNDHIFERDVPADEFAVRFDEEVDIEKGLNDLDELNITKDAVGVKKMLDNVDEAYGVTPEMKKELDELSGVGAPITAKSLELMKKYPGLNLDVARKIASDPDPQRQAEAIAMIDQAFEMTKKGMSLDEIVDVFSKNTDRTKQAAGGLSYLMGM